MKTVLFIILPYPSHYNASFGLAQEYQCANFRVVFTGYPHLRDHVEQQGYEFCHMHYTHEYQIRSIKGFISSFLLSLLDKKAVIKRYREWYRSVIEVKKLCAYYTPEQIFIDAHLSHYYLYLIDYQKCITVISTKLSTRRSPGLPPLNSFHVPKDTAWSRWFSEWLWVKYTGSVMLRDFIKRVAFLNRDERYFQRRLCRKLGLRWNDVFERQNTFFLGLKNVPTIILGDERLEFVQKKRFPEVTYRHWPIQRNETAYWSDEYRTVREKILTLKSQTDYRIVYCSFGSLGGLNRKRVLSFFPKLVAAVRGETIILVIATGGLPFTTDANSDLIFILPRVPQLDMLSLSDLMITHGGHNSVKECLQAGVPMLVYPLNLRVDQPGNAVRVYQAGYGWFGKVDRDGPAEIRRKIALTLMIGKKHLSKINSLH